MLLTCASVIALCAGSASTAEIVAAHNPTRTNWFAWPRDAKILWKQYSNDAGEHINSTNLTSGESSVYNNQAADDFVIPKGSSWRITGVDMPGAYFDGNGPASSENVTFYKDKRGMPGAAVKNGTFDNLNGSGGPNFSIVLPGKGLKLNAGHYWVSVVANMDFPTSGLWGPEVSTVQHSHQAMWQNPPDGYGVCPTWGTIEKCLGVSGPDLMFDLRGRSKK